MNIVLFSRSEVGRPLPLGDRRASHVIRVLRRKVGDKFDAGIINAERGTATIDAIDTTSLKWSFRATQGAPPAERISVLIGLPRPQTARDMLRDATTMGVAALHFVSTEKSDANYAKSTLWQENEWQRHAIAGAEQAFDTRIPVINHGSTMREALQSFTDTTEKRIALDNYEAREHLGAVVIQPSDDIALAVGPERGWSAADRALLREHHFAFMHLGTRVLRAETALIAALALLRSPRG